MSRHVSQPVATSRLVVVLVGASLALGACCESGPPPGIRQGVVLRAYSMSDFVTYQCPEPIRASVGILAVDAPVQDEAEANAIFWAEEEGAMFVGFDGWAEQELDVGAYLFCSVDLEEPAGECASGPLGADEIVEITVGHGPEGVGLVAKSRKSGERLPRFRIERVEE